MGEEKGLGGETGGKEWPLGRPGRRWVDNIGMDLQEVGCGTRLGWSKIETGGGLL